MTDGCGKNKLRVGIVGCGRITETRHAPEYAACENAEIIGKAVQFLSRVI